MPTLTSVTNHFITGKEGFTTTTSGSVASGATTIGLNSVSGYTNGDSIAFVIDPTDANKKQVFTGTIDTSGVQVTNVVWTEGTNQTHAAGATVVDYTTATHQAALVKGLLVSHDQDGTLKAGAVDNAAALASDVVTTSKILDSNVTTAKLADASVTPAKRSGGFFCGVIAGSTVTTTGIKNITGVGFTPKGVKFTIRRNSSQDIFFGVGAMDENGNQHYMYTVHDVSTTSGGGTNGGTTACMYMPDSSNVVDFVASYSSMNADGFSINVTDASSSIDSIQYEAFA